MGGLTSLNKGKRGEREVVKILQAIVDKVYGELGLSDYPQLERNLLQSHKGGQDIIGLDNFVFEVKYQESENLPAWWKQTLSHADRAKGKVIPVLFFRSNYKPWRVRLFSNLEAGGSTIQVPVDIAIPIFELYFYNMLKFQLGKSNESLNPN